MEQKKKPGKESVAETKPGKQRWRSKLWKWTGFGERRLWDWLELLGHLAIPVVLAVAGFWFTAQQGKNQRLVEAQRAQDTALQAYLDQMSALMLEENLRHPEGRGEVRTLARARTLTILSVLDPDVDLDDKGSVVQFLYESNLIDKNNPIVDLSNADLRSADLRLNNLSDVDLSRADLRRADLGYAELSGAVLIEAVLNEADFGVADLSGADLRGADLKEADLEEADLGGADLSGADLRGADLSDADLSKAYLDSADLTGADLTGADLRGANLTDALLLGTDLSGADLSDAQGVSRAELEAQSVKLKGTTMPEGTNRN